MTDLFPDLSNDPQGSGKSQREVRRLQKTLSVPPEASEALLPLFRQYRDEWNQIVKQDRSGVHIHRRTTVQREYLNRRKQSINPLRTRSWTRTVSIPVKAELKKTLKRWLDLDWRKIQKPRLHRHGSELVLRYVETTETVRPEPSRFRYDVGLCLTEEGLAIRLQSPEDLPLNRFIRKEQLTKQNINQLVEQMAQTCRVIALDSTIPESMLGIKQHLVRKIRNTQAEGATVFRSPRRVSLGEKYLGFSKSSPHHLNLWQRKLLKPWDGYSLILGLTGEPLLVREQDGRLVTGPLDKSVNPLLRANDALQTTLAKLDAWHTATSMSRRDRQRVRSAFRRLLLRTTATMLSEE